MNKRIFRSQPLQLLCGTFAMYFLFYFFWGESRQKSRLPKAPRTMRSASEEAAYFATEAVARLPASPECAVALSQLAAPAAVVDWPPQCPLRADSPLRSAFEIAGMPLTDEPWCFAQRYDGESERVLDWSASIVDAYCAGMADGKIVGTYGAGDVERLASVLAKLSIMHGSRGLVLGSERPWVECLALEAGAAEIWTLEYSTISSTHPRIKAKPYKIMAAERIAGTLPLADWAVSYSSLEHSGLGRYGDSINADGDKEAARHAWCMLKPGGFFVLAVPMSCATDGFIQFNAHRTYGWRRLAYISEGFELVGFPEKCIPGRRNNDIVILRKSSQSESKLMSSPTLLASDFDTASSRAKSDVDENVGVLGKTWAAIRSLAW